jgi:hypothetical protein
MDLAYQDVGMFQAYGLLFQLLHQGVPVAWVIDPDKKWHAAPVTRRATPALGTAPSRARAKSALAARNFWGKIDGTIVAHFRQA